MFSQFYPFSFRDRIVYYLLVPSLQFQSKKIRRIKNLAIVKMRPMILAMKFFLKIMLKMNTVILAMKAIRYQPTKTLKT